MNFLNERGLDQPALAADNLTTPKYELVAFKRVGEMIAMPWLSFQGLYDFVRVFTESPIYGREGIVFSKK